jgi:hypothetical protein
VLAGDPERFPAGGEERDVRAAAQDASGQRLDAREHVLAVVEDQQGAPGAERGDDALR